MLYGYLFTTLRLSENNNHLNLIKLGLQSIILLLCYVLFNYLRIYVCKIKRMTIYTCILLDRPKTKPDCLALPIGLLDLSYGRGCSEH